MSRFYKQKDLKPPNLSKDTNFDDVFEPVNLKYAIYRRKSDEGLKMRNISSKEVSAEGEH